MTINILLGVMLPFLGTALGAAGVFFMRGEMNARARSAVIGFAAGIMWPGTICVSSQSFPKGGTAMFAFLALAGDLGAAVSPTMVGSLAELAGGNLKTGLLVATVFPILLVCGLLALKAQKRN